MEPHQYLQYFYEISELQGRSKLINSQKGIPQLHQKLVEHQPSHLKQITQIVRSSQLGEAELAVKSGRMFEDHIFLPNNISLFGAKLPKDWHDMKFRWMRMHDIYESPKIFKERIEPDDVKQGQLGTCYFLAGLSALSESPKRIANLFITRKINTAHFYSVKVLYRGMWMEVLLDDWIPCLQQSGTWSPAFAYGNDEELWVMLLEKAWAKIYGNFYTIEGGYGQEALHDFTGAPVDNFECNGTEKTEDEKWEQLTYGTEWNFPMVCSTQGESDKETDKFGIVQGHVFTILGAYEVPFQEYTVRLVKIRNPWSSGQQTGKWADTDKRWKQIDEETKEEIGYNKDMEDGIFFCEFSHFLKRFADFSIAKVYDTFSYLSCVSTQPSPKGYFEIIIEKAGLYSFIVDQTPARSHGDVSESGYRDSIILVSKFEQNGNVEYICGKQKADRSVYVESELEPGRYMVYANILEQNANKIGNRDIVLGAYCEFPCTIRDVPKPPHFKTRFYLSHARANQDTEEEEVEGSTNEEVEEGLNVTQRYTEQGYQYIYLRNQSSKSYRFKFTISKGIEQHHLVPAEQIRGRKAWQCDLLPGNEKIYVCGGASDSTLYFVDHEYEEL